MWHEDILGTIGDTSPTTCSRGFADTMNNLRRPVTIGQTTPTRGVRGPVAVAERLGFPPTPTGGSTVPVGDGP